MSILKKGMSGAPVKRLQEKLGVDADGLYGAATERAVKEFQKSKGLVEDGLAGPDTFAEMGLHELVLLRTGTRGEEVRKLQEALGVDADGRFGPGTAQAVKEFQEKHGLKADGMAGPATLAKVGSFDEITPETVARAALRTEEAQLESEPMPELKGVDAVAGTSVEIEEEQSVWSRVKGWFS
ncbi:peptidoglycan-binding protein [Sulfitobacter sp. LCG007]